MRRLLVTNYWVWSKSVGDGEDKGDKEDKEESSFQPTTDDHTPNY